jgi:O-antigen ligase
MTVDVQAGDAAHDPAPAESAPAQAPRPEVRLASAALALLPAGLLVYLAFSGGGFSPAPVGFAALFVIQIFVVRVLFADDPFAGFGRPLAIVACLFAAYTAWVLASTLWFDSRARPLLEYDRALLYLLVLVVMGSVPRTERRMRWIVRGLAIAAFVVCAVGLVTRVLPDVWPIAPNVENSRLSYPITYWNALGIVAAIGALLATGLASSDSESRWGRALGAAAVPVFACTLFFTFSRGGIVALAVGFVAYLCVARQRALLGGLVAVLPPTVIAVVVAYGADDLATDKPTTAAAVDQGKTVAVVVLACMLAAAVLRVALDPADRWLARQRPTRTARRGIAGGLAVAALVVVGALVVAGAPSWAGDQWDRFLSGAAVEDKGDLRSRLSNPSNNGRSDHWNVAFDAFANERLRGHGAGSYEELWELHRTIPVTVVDGHGLYFENLAELGIVGLLLLVGTIIGILGAFLRRARGPNRGVYAALFGAGVAWAVHAGIDWDWEMPVVTAWVFAAGGAALAAPLGQGAEAGSHPLMRNRTAICAGLLVLAVTPVLALLSQARLNAAANAFNRGDCAAAKSNALSSISAFGARPQPYQILGYCQLVEGRTDAGVAAMRKAVEQEPGSWEFRFGLALALAESGQDPRPELGRVIARNPDEGLVVQARAEFAKAHSPEAWRRAAERVRNATTASGRLTLK